MVLKNVVVLVDENFDPADRLTLFQEIKKYSPITDIKGVVTLKEGYDITFLSQQAAVNFLAKAPKSWSIRTDLRQDLLVTVSPQVGEGHLMVDDEIFWAALSNYGEVKKGRKLYYEEFPSIENGVRQFIVIPRKGVVIPSSLRFGRAGFRVAYRDQAKTCHKCQSTGHLASECPTPWCNKCHQSGHEKAECMSVEKCTVCGDTGHSYDSCEKSYAIKVLLGKSWGTKKAQTEQHNLETNNKENSPDPNVPPLRATNTRSRSSSSSSSSDNHSDNDESTPNQDLKRAKTSLSSPASQSKKSGKWVPKHQLTPMKIPNLSQLSQSSSVISFTPLPLSNKYSGLDKNE